MRDSLTAHDTETPAVYVHPAPAPVPDVLPTLHAWEVATFLQHREAVCDTARDIVERSVEHTGDTVDTVPVMRSLVARIHGEADRIARHAHVYDEHTGDDDDTTPAPDGFTRVRATTRTERTNRGDTVEMVTVHGRAAVQGATTVHPAPEHSMSTRHAEAMLGTVPRATFGSDAISVYRATQALYGDSIPRLIGADVLTFHEFRAWDETRARTPRRGWQTRRRLATIRPRNGEIPAPVATVVDFTGADVPAWEPVTVARLLAPTGDERTAWVGHRLTVRPDTVRAQRAARRRTVTDSVHLRHTDDVARILRALAVGMSPGERIVWTVCDEHGRPTGDTGTLTASAGKRTRYSVTGLPAPVRGARTVDGLAVAVARAIGSTL